MVCVMRFWRGCDSGKVAWAYFHNALEIIEINATIASLTLEKSEGALN